MGYSSLCVFTSSLKSIPFTKTVSKVRTAALLFRYKHAFNCDTSFSQFKSRVNLNDLKYYSYILPSLYCIHDLQYMASGFPKAVLSFEEAGRVKQALAKNKMSIVY